MSTHQEDQPSSSTPLLSSSAQTSSTQSTGSANTTTSSTNVVATTVSAAVSVAFAVLFFSWSSPSPSEKFARPLTKLDHPVVILISADGFRFGYQFKTSTPNIHRLIDNGTEAKLGLIPVYPSETFPNHYSIATGLYPAYHGIIYNEFKDPHTNHTFSRARGSHEPEWWFGEPLWETVVNNGLKAATYYWPGSEVGKGKWNCTHDLCGYFRSALPFESRVDSILKFFDSSNGEEIPAFIALYFEEPDGYGHRCGPDHPSITQAITRIDDMIGRLIEGLEERNVFEDVTIILLGDHGMVGICDDKYIFLEDLAPWIKIPTQWVEFVNNLAGIRPADGYSPSDVLEKMEEGLKSGNVTNGQYMKVYLKEKLPSRLHFVENDRIPPIIGMVEEGFLVRHNRSSRRHPCGGSHGYDNALFSMRSIFIGHGPRFAKGEKVPSFENVEVYNLVTSILNITGAPNNGTASFPGSVLLPPTH